MMGRCPVRRRAVHSARGGPGVLTSVLSTGYVPGVTLDGSQQVMVRTHGFRVRRSDRSARGSRRAWLVLSCRGPSAYYEGTRYGPFACRCDRGVSRGKAAV